MISISNSYKEKIIKMFGDTGKIWLEGIPTKIEKYSKLLNLKNLELVSDLTYNMLFYADNDEYGKVVLKIELPFKELTYRESTALTINNGIGSCKLYYSNIDDGVILLERLIPGNSLEHINDLNEKVKTFIDVSNKFNTKLNDISILPTYNEILQRSIDIINNRNENDVYNLICDAKNKYNVLEKKYDSNYLIHSDLYPGNILKSNDEWKCIDPHGFIGCKIIECAIFIQKELESDNFSKDKLNLLLDTFENYTRYSKKDLCVSLYINYILNICWNIEINMDNDYINKCIKNTNLIYEKYNNYKKH